MRSEAAVAVTMEAVVAMAAMVVGLVVIVAGVCSSIAVLLPWSWFMLHRHVQCSESCGFLIEEVLTMRMTES
jgi:hypothetical protein